MKSFHGRDLRKGRRSIIGQAYVVTTVTASRLPIFTDLPAVRCLVAAMRAAVDRGQVESIAWVAMPDHLHWLFTLQDGDLGNLVQRVKSDSAIGINRARRGRGAVWQRGYHDHALRSDETLLATARYIIANPLRAGIVRHIGDYLHWDCIFL